MTQQLSIKSLTTTLLLSSCLLITTTALAAEPTNDQPAPTTEIKQEKKSDTVTTLAELANLAERWFKTKVLVGDRADAKIHINLGKDSLSYGQLLTQLNLNGFTAYKSNDYIQIISNREARNFPIPFVEKNKFYLEDEYVTDVLITKKACAYRILTVIRPLVFQHGFLSVHEESNALIIVDTYGNIQRIKTVIKAIEADLNEKEECNKIKKAEALPEKK